jgi:hypothetical protein
MFISNSTRFSSENRTCEAPNCTLLIDGFSKLTTLGTLIVSDGARVVSSNNSDILIQRGNLLVSRKATASIRSGSRLIVNGTATLSLGASLRASQGLISIGGSLSCSGSDSAILLQDNSQLRVGGSISLSDGCLIGLSNSLLSADLGQISTDNSSAIYLSDRSVLSGTGTLDAIVYSFNSSTLLITYFHVKFTKSETRAACSDRRTRAH